MKPLLSIQYLRALAALGVVAYHTGRATILGQAGVDVFFVISGFIMWMVTAKPVGARKFLWHRIIRIVPLYWIATIIMAAHRGSPAHDIVRSLLFWPYRDAGGQVWPILVQGWTLNYEMFFYLLFATILMLPRCAQLLCLTAVLCSLGAIGIAVQPHHAALHTFTNPLFMEFLAGVWLSDFVRRRQFPSFYTALAMVAVGLAGFIISMREPTPEVWRFIVWGVPSLLVVGGAVSIELRCGLFNLKPLKLLGDGSYSIYLFHPFVLRTVESPLVRFPAFIPVIACTVAGAAVGMAAFYLLELPVTARLKGRTERPIAATEADGVSTSRR